MNRQIVWKKIRKSDYQQKEVRVNSCSAEAVVSTILLATTAILKVPIALRKLLNYNSQQEDFFKT